MLKISPVLHNRVPDMISQYPYTPMESVIFTLIRPSSYVKFYVFTIDVIKHNYAE